MRFILDLCTAFFAIYLFIICIYVVGDFIRFFRLKKQDKNIKWRDLDKRILSKKTFAELFAKKNLILTLILFVGLSNHIASNIFGSTQIGDFYEKYNYTEKYEALIYPEGTHDYISCVAEIRRDTNFIEDARGRTETELVYYIDSLTLPLGRKIHVGEPFNPNKTIRLNIEKEYGIPFYMELGEIADEESYRYLKNIYTKGKYCGSKYSTKYHYRDCQYVDRIYESNKIHFRTPAEASVLGYEICSVCSNRGSD